jgi:amphi-Trp domain-containing protein
MKYQDKYVGSQVEIMGYLKELPKKLMQNILTVEDEKVSIPADKELEYKIKYENDEAEGALAVKISWTNAEAEEEEVEEED